LLSFVLFEVIKMILVTRSIFSQVEILRRPEARSNPQQLVKALNDLDESQQSGRRGFIITWAITVAISLGGALVGVAILGYAFITGLAK
jgi:hypothetical protein